MFEKPDEISITTSDDVVISGLLTETGGGFHRQTAFGCEWLLTGYSVSRSYNPRLGRNVHTVTASLRRIDAVSPENTMEASSASISHTGGEDKLDVGLSDANSWRRG